MGRVNTKVTVTNVGDINKVKTFDVLVDTGASLLTLPARWKDDFGPFGYQYSESVKLADEQRGGQVEICGPVLIQIDGFRAIANEVAFLEDACEPLLGYIPLEQTGVVVDMIGHRLLKIGSFDLK